MSDAIEQALTAYGQRRDAATERLFQVIYDAPVTQALSPLPPPPRRGCVPARRRTTASSSPLPPSRLRARMAEGGLHEARPRALVWVRLSGGRADERSFATIRLPARGAWPEDAAAAGVPAAPHLREFFMLLVDEPQALATLPDSLLVTSPSVRSLPG